MMVGITWIHVAGGMAALASGAVAISVRKGGSVHASAGIAFCAAMFVLGITASILGPFKSPPDSPVGGMMVCYFVATAWMTARRRDGRPGSFEKIAGAFMLLLAAAIIADGFRRAVAPPGQFAVPPSPGVVITLGVLCLLAGIGDWRFIVRGRLSPTQRITRHLWRMCFALFVASGSFFLGQAKVFPKPIRILPLLAIPAFLPLLILVYWMGRVLLTRWYRRSSLSFKGAGELQLNTTGQGLRADRPGASGS